MAVLKFEPTKAPDFSSTSTILARAGLSLDRAFESAEGLLGSYQAGQQEKIDNEIFAETAGMNREQLQAFFDKNGLKGRALSKTGRDRLGSRFADIADINRTRGLIDSTSREATRLDAGQAIRQAAADRVERDDVRSEGKRQFGIDNAADQFAVEQAALSGVSLPGAAAPVVSDPRTADATLRAAAPGGSGGAPPAPVSGVETIGGGSRAPAHLVSKESGGSFQATNESVGSGGIVGHDGRVQFGAARLQDVKNAGVIPKDMTREQFRNDPQAQIAAENWHFDDIDTNIQKNGYSKYIGTVINGVEVTHQGMVDVQHLGGATGLKKFLESNGAYDVEDDNKTKLSDYMRRGGAAEAKANVVPISGGPIDTQSLDPIAVAAAPVPRTAAPTGPLGPGGFRLTTPGSENVASDFATAIPTLTDPSKTSPGVLDTGPVGVPAPGGSPLPAGAAATLADPIAVAAGANINAGASSLTSAPAANGPSSTLRAELRQRRIDSGFFTGDDLNTIAAGLTGSEVKGKAVRTAKRALVVQERNAGLLLEGLNSPTIHDQAGLVKFMRGGLPEGTTNVEELATYRAAADGATEWMSILNPDIDLPDGVVDATVTAMAIDNTTLAALPQTFTNDLAKTFLGSPTAPRDGLIALLNLDTDTELGEVNFWLWGEDGKDINILQTLIGDIAEDAHVTHAVAAAAMAKFFVRNPTGSNTHKKRFRQEDTTAWLVENMNPTAMGIYESKRLSILARRDEFKQDTKDLTKMMVTQKKQVANGTDTGPIDKKIERLTNTMLRGQVSGDLSLAKEVYKAPDGTGLVDFLNTLPVGSSARSQLQESLTAQVEGDKALSRDEKRLLLAEIKG